MKTYIINMAKDTAKRAAIEAQLKKYPELDYEIFPAVEGMKLSDEELIEYGYDAFFNKYVSFGTLPAFGCSISHYLLYKKIAADNLDFALILEDDAILSQQLKKKLPSIKEYINSFECPVIVLLTPDFLYKKKEKTTIDNAISITKVRQGYMTSGYIINREAALLLSTKLFPIKYLADEWGEFIKMGLNLYGTIPHLISYPDGLGEIGKSQHHKKENWLLRVRHIAGQLKWRLQYALRYINGYRKSKRKW